MDAIKYVIGKIAVALKEMSSKGLTHGNLSASSIVFDVSDPSNVLLVDRCMALDQA